MLCFLFLPIDLVNESPFNFLNQLVPVCFVFHIMNEDMMLYKTFVRLYSRVAVVFV